MKFQRPAQVDDVAREFRELTLVVAHFGVPWVDEAMCLVGKHDRVYVDLSFWSVLETTEEMMRQLRRAPRFGCGYDRMLWGTDYPMVPPIKSLQLFREELPQAAKRIGVPPLAQEELDLILGENARRVFDL
jgi:predicted TIM-barrel fold metal-dependent hydrolase